MLTVGLVVPTMNSASFVQESLHSIFQQTGDFRIHVHVQDGGSSDGTQELVRQLSETVAGDRKLISTSFASSADSGVAQALNNGFRHLDADIFGWLGSDDILFPGALSSVVSHVVQTRSQWVTGLPTVIDTTGRILSLRGKQGPHRYPTGFARGLLARGFHSNGLVGGIQQEGTFWTRDLWNQSGGYIDESLKLAFDYELWCRLARHSEVVQLVAPLAAFRIRSGQLSSNADLYRSEVAKVKRSLRERGVGASMPSTFRDFQRPVSFLSPVSAEWTTRRYTFGGKPFSRLAEKLFSARGKQESKKWPTW